MVLRWTQSQATPLHCVLVCPSHSQHLVNVVTVRKGGVWRCSVMYGVAQRCGSVSSVTGRLIAPRHVN
jgi:hypothetical protein